MADKQALQDKDARNRMAERKLSNINLFFSAFGNFLNGIFCISQFFLTGKPLFWYITLGIVVIILAVTYGTSYSKASLKNEKLWEYIARCANRLGSMNPVFLLLSIIFALNASIETIVLWIAMEFLQLWLYAFEFRKEFPHFGLAFIRKTSSWIRKNIALIITFILALIFGVLWYISPENNRYADLWLNLSAGFIASSITISVIDRILKKQKEMDERPLRQAMYRDIQLFASRFISMWQEMYVHSVETRKNMTVDEFFEPSSIEVIRNSLDLSCKANVYPEQTWFSHIANSSQDLEERGQKILSTYASIAEPEVLQAIHYLINDGAYIGGLKLISKIYAYDVKEHFPRVPILSCYSFEPKETDSIMVSQLFNWCRTEYEKLCSKTGDTELVVFSIPRELNFEANKTKATSAITEEKLCRIELEYQQRQQSKEPPTT